jgi:ribonuclease D
MAQGARDSSFLSSVHGFWPWTDIRLPGSGGSGSFVSASHMIRRVGCCEHADLAECHALMAARGAVHALRGDLPDELAAAFAATPRVAWDVETSGLDWRHDRLGTCQLFAENLGVAVVSVNAARPTRLMALLENPDVEKVFHHAPFDLRFMVHAWGVQPTSIRCTKVASKLLEPGAPNEAHSLRQLVFRHLGVSLAKGEVRTSDWSAGRLSAEQLEYAAGDVLHLPALLEVLETALQSAGRGALYDACCTFLPAQVILELGAYPDVFAY